jgi:hypothetical protein
VVWGWGTPFVYVLVTSDVMKAESAVFRTLNLTGAAGDPDSLARERAYQPARF